MERKTSFHSIVDFLGRKRPMRSTSATTYATLSRKVVTYSNGLPGSSISLDWNSNRLTDSSLRDDIVKVPFIKGFRVPLPYTGRGYHEESALVHAERRVSPRPTQDKLTVISGTVVDGTNVVTAQNPTRLISPGMRQRLTVDLLKRIGDQKWSLGQAVIEARDAVGLLGKTATNLSTAMSYAVRKDWRSLAKHLGVKQLKLGKKSKDVSSGWLEYSFAWSPLVDDMAGLALLLGGELAENRSFTVMARSSMRRTEKSQNPGSATLNAPSGGSNIGYTFIDGVTKQSDLKMSLYYEINSSKLAELQQIGVVGLSTPWAILPMSYLVDWILPIGDVLAAYDATIGLTYLGGSYTHFDLTRVKRKSAKIIPVASTISSSFEFFANEASSWDMQRTVFATSPVVFPCYIKDPFSVWRTVTSIALFRQFQNK